ncbi:hypothetical protein T4C_504 [Trichinella pseudospiralis]|uniref:Peptidase A2 domain-containing protein n=1 Tax=Trichinella pseudospiralis TaxID=6337 RepID=A0A0V1IK59_TRIPS|nr:hypothetical protein T4C_504 [Trichinella pseudospiralis]
MNAGGGDGMRLEGPRHSFVRLPCDATIFVPSSAENMNHIFDSASPVCSRIRCLHQHGETVSSWKERLRASDSTDTPVTPQLASKYLSSMSKRTPSERAQNFENGECKSRNSRAIQYPHGNNKQASVGVRLLSVNIRAPNQIHYQTVKVMACGTNGKRLMMNCLFDSGDETTLVTEKVARALNVVGSTASVIVNGIGNFVEMLPKICDNIRSICFRCGDCKHLESLQLADEQEEDLLIHAIQPFRSRIQSRQEEDKAEETLNKFWELDSISILCQQENYDTGCGVFTNCALAEHKVSEINPATLRAVFTEVQIM